jgi:hypothetical protein
MRHRSRGRGVGGRGAGRRTTWRSPAGRHGAKEAGALAGKVMGGGGRGACRWCGGVRCSRKRCSPAGVAWGGGGRGTMSGSARSGDTGLGCVESGVVRSIGRREVERVAWARAQDRSVVRVGFDWSDKPLDPGDRSLIHHHR